MNLELLLVLVFVATLGLVISAIYFFFAAPAEKKQVRDRLEALRELAVAEGESLETQLLRQEVLSGVPAIHRLLMKLPGMKELNLFIQQSATDITVGMLLLLSLLIFAFVLLLCLVVGLFARAGVVLAGHVRRNPLSVYLGQATEAVLQV